MTSRSDTQFVSVSTWVKRLDLPRGTFYDLRNRHPRFPKPSHYFGCKPQWLKVDVDRFLDGIASGEIDINEGRKRAAS